MDQARDRAALAREALAAGHGEAEAIVAGAADFIVAAEHMLDT